MNRRTVFSVIGITASVIACILLRPLAAAELPVGPGVVGVVSVVPLSAGDKLLVLESGGDFEMPVASQPRSWSVMRVRDGYTELFEVGVLGQGIGPGQVIVIGDRKTPAGRNNRGESLTHHNIQRGDKEQPGREPDPRP